MLLENPGNSEGGEFENWSAILSNKCLGGGVNEHSELCPYEENKVSGEKKPKH